MDHMDSWSCMQWWRTNRNFTKLHQGTWQFKHEPSCRVRAYRFRLVAFWISFRANKKNLWLEASGCKHQTAIVCLRPKRESYVPRFYWWYTPRRVQSWRLRKGDDNRKHSNIFYLQGPFFARATFQKAFHGFSMLFYLIFHFSRLQSLLELSALCTNDWSDRRRSIRIEPPANVKDSYVTLKEKISAQSRAVDSSRDWKHMCKTATVWNHFT